MDEDMGFDLYLEEMYEDRYLDGLDRDYEEEAYWSQFEDEDEGNYGYGYDSDEYDEPPF